MEWIPSEIHFLGPAVVWITPGINMNIESFELDFFCSNKKKWLLIMLRVLFAINKCLPNI